MTMRVWEINEDFIAARSEEEAVAAFREECGIEPEEIELLSDEVMDRWRMEITDENDEFTGETKSFREYLHEETNGKDCDAFMIGSRNF